MPDLDDLPREVRRAAISRLAARAPAVRVKYKSAVYAAQTVLDESMPPAKYRMAHPEADPTRQEEFEFARGLDATIKETAQD